DRVETQLGDNIMGDMQIVATYSGWKDFGGGMAPSKIVQTRGGWPFFEVTVTAAKADPPDGATNAMPPAPAGRRRGPRRPGRRPGRGAHGDDREARRRPVEAHDGRRQLRLDHRRVQGLRDDARGRAAAGARNRVRRRGQEARAEQADSLRVELAPA